MISHRATRGGLAYRADGQEQTTRGATALTRWSREQEPPHPSPLPGKAREEGAFVRGHLDGHDGLGTAHPRPDALPVAMGGNQPCGAAAAMTPQAIRAPALPEGWLW